MREVPRKDRLAFWTFTSASATFQAARRCLKELRKDGGVQDNNLRYAIVCAFVVFYGRAFKQKKDVRLIEAMIPEEYKALHKHLLVLRDKTFAHLDPDGPDANAGALNKSRIEAKEGGFSSALNFFNLKEEDQKRAEKLLLELEKKCAYHAVKIWKRHVGKNGAPDGEYEVSIGAEASPLLKPWKPSAAQEPRQP
jgi:hypothetical protein